MNLGPIDPYNRYGVEHGGLADRMNLIGGTRVGWEEKQKYRDHLIEMFTKGYLNQDEYDARIEWVEQVQTIGELGAALMDLPRMPLTEQPKPEWKRPTDVRYFIRKNPWYSGYIAAFEWAVFILGCIMGAPFTITIGGVFGVMWTVLTIKRIHDENILKGK